MWGLRVWNTCCRVLTLAAFCVGLYPRGQAITIISPEYSLVALVAKDVLLSVQFTCVGTPTIEWTFMSTREKRNVASWRPGFYHNVSDGYQGRVHLHSNGSITLLGVSLSDSGFYKLTVTEATGSSKDAAIVLTVREVLFEDVQYLAVFITILGTAAGFLMITMWLLNKAYTRMKEWCQTRSLPEHTDIELEAL